MEGKILIKTQGNVIQKMVEVLIYSALEAKPPTLKVLLIYCCYFKVTTVVAEFSMRELFQ